MTLDRFYPIFDHSDWLRRMLPLGNEAGAAARQGSCRMTLYVRRLASRAIYAVIMGRCWWSTIIGNMPSIWAATGCIWGKRIWTTADLKTRFEKRGLKLGVSTHDDDELERVLAMDPDYVALGPVYPTILKKMKWHQQGLPRVTEWKARVGDIPLVGIGGMSVERAAGRVGGRGGHRLGCHRHYAEPHDPEARVHAWIEATR